MKNRLIFIPAAVIILGLFITGSFLDLQISQAVANVGNLYTKIFATLSCFPVALTLSIFSGISVKYIQKNKLKVPAKVGLIIYAIGAFIVAALLPGREVIDYQSFNLPKACILIGLLVSTPGFILGLYLYKFVPTKHLIRNILFISIVVAFTSGCVEVIKMLAPRVRFRAFAELGNTDLFRPWWQPSLTDAEMQLVKALDNGKDLLKSFPSGHSNVSLSSAFILMFVPVLFNKENWIKYQWIFFYGGFIYFLICAFSRVVGGDHYLTDTMFSALFALFVFVIANEIYLRKIVKYDNTKNR